MSELWVVWYIFHNGMAVIVGLYEDESEADAALRNVKDRFGVVNSGKSLEPVFYKRG